MNEERGAQPTVTMQDVARLAGVSQSTVSHFVNDTRTVHPDTRRAIQSAIEQTGYVHDALARSLRTGRSNTIGVAISAISNPYFASLVRQIERQVSETGRIVILVDTHDEPERELESIRKLLQHRPDAVLLAPARASSPALDLLLQHDVPTVLVDRLLPDVPDRVDAIGVHNREPMARLVEHLAVQGHRRIGLLAGLAGIPTTTERIAGFRDGVAAVGDDGVAPVEHASAARAATDAAMDRLMDVGATAVVGGNNQATIAALRWLQAHDLDVPGDVSLASFDDFEWSELFHPRLTAIRQPIEELADTAASLLMTRLEAPDRASRVVRLEPRFIVRDSTGPPA